MGVRAPLPLLEFLEVWLSLVECSVRDAEVASSNLVTSIQGPIGQAAKTVPSHGTNPGSIPGLVIKGRVILFLCSLLIYACVAQLVVQLIRNE